MTSKLNADSIGYWYEEDLKDTFGWLSTQMSVEAIAEALRENLPAGDLEELRGWLE